MFINLVGYYMYLTSLRSSKCQKLMFLRDIVLEIHSTIYLIYTIYLNQTLPFFYFENLGILWNFKLLKEKK
jgi:hypothetical protein